MSSVRSAPTATLAVAIALALSAAVSLGLARFSYALLLPPMRTDLGWSYFTAGSMNTANAAGYLFGALLAPGWLRRCGPRRLLLAGGGGSALLLALHGAVQADTALYVLRLLTGMSSAAAFVSGGLMAARLGGGGRFTSGLVLGLYYGGVGLGIVMSALIVPPLTALPVAHAWQWAWVALAACALLATVFTAHATRGIDGADAGAGVASHFRWRWLGFSLGSYFLFGLGYIGYMTFVVTLLRERQLGDGPIAAFYALLGLGCVASSWLWAGLLQRFRGGQPMALLNGLLAGATLLPVLSAHPVAVFASGALFGGVFLSVVASTTALVRHNLPVGAWARGISAFTIMFAAGQIVGPSLVGWVADGAGGLRMGFAASAAVLALGSLLALAQRPLTHLSGQSPGRPEIDALSVEGATARGVLRLNNPMDSSVPIEVDTARLRLRQWRASDGEAFSALNADPRVMACFPSVLPSEASLALLRRLQAQIAEQGWGIWALELRSSSEFIGFTGLQVPSMSLPFSPCVEIGWRLAFGHWGRGLASEAASAALQVGFERLQLDEIVSFTSVGNGRSRAVMERLGMQQEAATFGHPAVPASSPLREHCLYRLSRERWAMVNRP